MTLASTLDLFTKKKTPPPLYSVLLQAQGCRPWGRHLPFTVSSEDECKCEHTDGGEAVPTIWPSSTDSTRGGALCWQRRKQATKWTPGPIKIHQVIWFGCPVSTSFAAIKSKVKWNVPFLHISVMIVALECARHVPVWTELLYGPGWLWTPEQMVMRYGERSKGFLLEDPPYFIRGDRPAQGVTLGGNHSPCLHRGHLQRGQQWHSDSCCPFKSTVGPWTLPSACLCPARS